MSSIISAARATLIALAVASPVAAFAQTPRDVANLVWQQNVPVYVSSAPAASASFAGAGSAADLARALQTNNVSSHVSNAPLSGASFATAFGPRDLARLTGSPAPSLFATGNTEITVAEGVHQ
jgi:hypothetical protein